MTCRRELRVRYGQRARPSLRLRRFSTLKPTPSLAAASCHHPAVNHRRSMLSWTDVPHEFVSYGSKLQHVRQMQ